MKRKIATFPVLSARHHWSCLAGRLWWWKKKGPSCSLLSEAVANVILDSRWLEVPMNTISEITIFPTMEEFTHLSCAVGGDLLSWDGRREAANAGWIFAARPFFLFNRSSYEWMDRSFWHDCSSASPQSCFLQGTTLKLIHQVWPCVFLKLSICMCALFKCLSTYPSLAVNNWIVLCNNCSSFLRSLDLSDWRIHSSLKSVSLCHHGHRQ